MTNNYELRRITPTGRRAYSVREVSDAWGVSPQVVRALIRSGELQAFRLSASDAGTLRVLAESLAAYEARQAAAVDDGEATA